MADEKKESSELENHGDMAIHDREKGMDVPSRSLVHDPAAERRVVRKIDKRLVPLVTALYMLAFLDRSNIGNAKVAGMDKYLGLSSSDYQWLLTIFYIAYILFEVCVFGWKIMPPHYWATIVVFGWGLVSTLQAATTNWSGMMALRFLMGAFEASYGPGTPYLLSFFYLRHEIGTRIGIFLSAAPLATTFAGALAYGITSGSPSIQSWRLLFLVEGLPTICMAAVAFFFMPDSPHTAKFLNEEEKQIALARGVRQVGEPDRIGGINFKDIFDTFRDPKAYFTALMYFSCNVSFASIAVFLPTIIKDMGFTAVNAQGLTAPPFFLSFFLTIGSAYFADRIQQRGYMVMATSIIGGIGYIILATASSVGARYFATFLAAGGVFPAIANILPWVLNNQGNDTRRGSSIMILNIIGQCGPILGTRLYPDSEASQFVKGQSVCAAFMFFTTLLAFGLRILLSWENGKLDKQYGTIKEQRARTGQASDKERTEGVENLGPMYRYVL